MSEDQGLPKFKSQYLNDYLAMVEESESPRLYHVWTALGTISSALGRRCYLPTGVGKTFPNQYVLLVGPPAMKKSTALRVGEKLLENNTHIRFAPSDTGGQRQGLAAAMHSEGGEDTEQAKEDISRAAKDNTLANLGDVDIMNMDMGAVNEAIEETVIPNEDKHNMVAIAKEFTGLIGQKNVELLQFLTMMWDGDDYEYRTKLGQMKLKDPLLTILGGTTPTSLASAMPPEAGGQGLLSRMILVYGAEKYKSVPWPTMPPVELVNKVDRVVSEAYNNMYGAFSMTPEAKEYGGTLYEYKPEINDSRFAHYNDRRFEHLKKAAMALAASRGSQEIQQYDFEEAHRILQATETGMSDALGQFGLSPDAVVKQGIMEYLRSVRVPVDMTQLFAMMHKDVKSKLHLSTIVQELTQAGEVVIVRDAAKNTMHIQAKQDIGAIDSSIMRGLLAK